MKRTRPFLSLALAVLGGAIAILGVWRLVSCAGAEKRFNVVLITLDTTRADYLGCYGRPGNPTPNLDALAVEGTRFDMAISSAAVTPVSHASILTGLDNREHGLRVLIAESGFRLPDNIPTLATILHDAGWSTAAVHSAFPVSAFFGFQRGFDVFDSFTGAMGMSQAGTVSFNLFKEQRRSDETTDLVLEHLADTKRPFFLWVHYWDPHDEIMVPPAELLGPNVPRLPNGLIPASKELYAAEVSYVDSQFGRLVADLKSRGEYEHTLFVVIADHGEGLGDHDWDNHRILYQEQIRVPLIVRVPGAKPAASNVAAVVRSVDVAPTILDYAGVKAPRPMSGRSLRALIEGRADEPRVAFADQNNGYDLNAKMVEKRPYDDFLYAVIDAPWKLIWRPMHPEKSELFDLAHDPHELASRFEHETDVVRKLEVELARHDGFVTAPFPVVPGLSNLSGVSVAQAQQMLTAIGYVRGSGNSDYRWVFFCPVHPAEIADQPEPCPKCNGPRLIVRRGH